MRTVQALVFDARCVAGPRVKTTTGFAVVATSGIRSTREESVRRVFTSGRLPNVCRALAGHCILIGTRGDSSAEGHSVGRLCYIEVVKRQLQFRSSLRLLGRSRLSY